MFICFCTLKRLQNNKKNKFEDVLAYSMYNCTCALRKKITGVVHFCLLETKIRIPDISYITVLHGDPVAPHDHFECAQCSLEHCQRKTTYQNPKIFKGFFGNVVLAYRQPRGSRACSSWAPCWFGTCTTHRPGASPLWPPPLGSQTNNKKTKMMKMMKRRKKVRRKTRRRKIKEKQKKCRKK